MTWTVENQNYPRRLNRPNKERDFLRRIIVESDKNWTGQDIAKLLRLLIFPRSYQGQIPLAAFQDRSRRGKVYFKSNANSIDTDVSLRHLSKMSLTYLTYLGLFCAVFQLIVGLSNRSIRFFF